jgi:hypothetical protein
MIILAAVIFIQRYFRRNFPEYNLTRDKSMPEITLEVTIMGREQRMSR